MASAWLNVNPYKPIHSSGKGVKLKWYAASYGGTFGRVKFLKRYHPEGLL